MLVEAVKIVGDIKKDMERDAATVRKAASLALSKEGYRLMKEGSFALKTGKLGLTSLTELRNKPKGFRRRNRNPLASLFRSIGYKVDRQRLTLRVGFTSGATEKSVFQRRVAEKSASGYVWHYDDKHIAKMHKLGVHIHKASAIVPTRDIMGMVEVKYAGESARNIRTNFERKMMGERI